MKVVDDPVVQVVVGSVQLDRFRELIVEFSATDHGGKRGSDSACTTGSRLWISVPQIMEEIVEVFSGSEEPQFMAVFSAIRRLDGVLCIFRAPPGRLELSASFSSPRALTPVSARGLLVISFCCFQDRSCVDRHIC